MISSMIKHYLVWLAQALELSYSFADKSPLQFPNVNVCELVIGPWDYAGRDRLFWISLNKSLVSERW
jgi:hypothetical protein